MNKNVDTILWQTPVKTELWASRYADFLSKKPAIFCEFFFFPWATLIDANRKFDYATSFSFHNFYHAPPKKTLLRATVCQHIYATDMVDVFKRINITDLFWSHAKINQPYIDGIRIHPFPLYPVACEVPLDASMKRAASDRHYLYSFIGAYEPNLYLTPVRKWIFELPYRSDAIVVERSEWHFEKQVYGEQICGLELTTDDKLDLGVRVNEYKSTLARSIFSLCPSGSGPNSIRLWESLGFGCIPVLLSDALRLPGDQALWDRAIVRVAEKREAVAGLPKLLGDIAKDKVRLLNMQAAGKELWNLYGLENGPRTILGEFTSKDTVRKLILG